MLHVLPQEALYSANFILDVSNLFDYFQGTKLAPALAHVEIWKKALEKIPLWKFIDAPRPLPFLRSWQITLYAAIQLWEDMQEEGRAHLSIGSLTQDPLENFFSRARSKGGHRLTMACKEFTDCFTKVLVNDLTRTPKGKNCRDDNTVNLLLLEPLLRAAERHTAAANSSSQEEDEEAVGDVEPLPV